MRRCDDDRSSNEVFSCAIIDAAAQLDLTMLDIGTRDGFDHDAISLAGGICAVGFEPDPGEAERLEKSSHAPWRMVKVLGCAIGGKTGTATLHVPVSPFGASLLPHNEDMLEEYGYEALHKTAKMIDVAVVTLDDLMADGTIKNAHYIKIDIEGAELDVLQAASRVLTNCQSIKVEVSFVEQRVGQPLAHEVIAFLQASGFTLVDIRHPHRWRRRPLPAHPFVSGFDVPYSRGRIAQADLLFFRRHDKSSLPTDVSAAMLLAAAMGYFDFAVGLLRSNPNATHCWQDRGICIEAELRTASRFYGRAQLRRAIRDDVRRLVPLLRSLLGRLPHSRPIRPY
jgi:FkbM family methyltransferase